MCILEYTYYPSLVATGLRSYVSLVDLRWPNANCRQVRLACAVVTSPVYKAEH
jgi:hypothetical protein